MDKRINEITYRTQTLAEEVANAITHGLGLLLSIAALTIMVAFAALQQDPWKIVSGAIFGTSLIAMYSASTLYHSISNKKVKRVFKVIDHSTIYLLIAGSYTPFALVTLHGAWGWTLFGISWGLAGLGVLFKIFFINRFETFSVILYLLMGWLVVVAINHIYHALPFAGFIWLAAGGLSYTLGVIFYVLDRYPFCHSIWHLFVLGGSVCHFFAVLFYVISV